MRILTLTDMQGNKVGTIIQSDDGTLSGEEKGESLLEQAPTKTFDDWLEHGHHSKYLRYQEGGE